MSETNSSLPKTDSLLFGFTGANNRTAYFGAYFRQVREDIERERDANKLNLEAYYDSLISQVDRCEQKFKEQPTSNSSNNDKFELASQFLTKYQQRLRELATFKFDIDQFTPECVGEYERLQNAARTDHDKLSQKLSQLEIDFKEQFTGDQSSIAFKRASELIRFETLCGYVEHSNCIDSLILSPRLKRQLIELANIDVRRQHFELIYRASRDGFTAASFHAKCDDKARTLCVIKSAETQCIFGGYTEVSWNEVNKAYKTDPAAFIFSLVRNQDDSAGPMRINCKTGGANAIRGLNSYGPIFGNGDDICISFDKKTTYGRLGKAYDFKLHAFASPSADNFLAGSLHFDISELEVYKIY